MRVFRRIVPLLVLAAAGCTTAQDRRPVLAELNPAPMSQRAWSQVVGTYTGPIHAKAERVGFEGLMAMETRLDLSGWSDAPDVVFRADRGYSTAWNPYGEWRGTFTNIPAKRYGSQGEVFATTHAPDQLLLILRRDQTITHRGAWLILTFRMNGTVDAEWIGRSGWRGEGELLKVPVTYNPR